MKRSDSIAEISQALTKFQKSAPKITKEKTANVPMKTGGSYSYKYADLSVIWDKIRGHLADNGLAVIQSPTTQMSEQALTTMVSHKSGEWVEDTMRLNIMQETPQGQGSAITYARRYAMCSMLGIVADDDTDAQDHRPASSVDKQRLYAAAKKVVPEIAEDPIAAVRFISEVVGKHPNRILETEVEDAIQAIQLYTADQIKK